MIKTVFLLYHELESASAQLSRCPISNARYIVRESQFREQLKLLHSLGFAGLSVSEALRNDCSAPSVVFTFDDGCESDLIVAASALREYGFGGTFYAVSDFVGRTGHLSASQLRALNSGRFEIGCHSRTHANLARARLSALRDEVMISKIELEQVLGTVVHHFSCPGGFWSKELEDLAREAGYLTVSTSRAGVNNPSYNRFQLARIAIYRNDALRRFEKICRGHTFFPRRGFQLARQGARSIVGESIYSNLRKKVLGIIDDMKTSDG